MTPERRSDHRVIPNGRLLPGGVASGRRRCDEAASHQLRPARILQQTWINVPVPHDDPRIRQAHHEVGQDAEEPPVHGSHFPAAEQVNVDHDEV